LDGYKTQRANDSKQLLARISKTPERNVSNSRSIERGTNSNS